LGHLDVAALTASCTELLSRHAVLRSRFVESGGQPRAVPGPATALRLRHADLSASGAPDGALAEAARAEAGRPFDLAAGPPVRALLVRLAPDDHVLLLTIHHIATDAWSNAVLLEELGALYRGGTLPAAPRFADFAVWQRERLAPEVRDRVAAYWRGTLAAAPQGIELPTDRPRSANRARRAARLVSTVPGEHLAALVRFCQAIRVPTFAGLMAVLQVLLHRYGRATDFLVGVPFSGRQRPELMKVVGPLFTTVPLRADVSGAPSFAELAARVRTAAADAFAHSALPADRFRTDTRGTLPYDVLFALQDAPRPSVELAGLTIEHIELGEGTAQCPLTLSAVPEAGGLRMVTDYDRELFDPDTVAQLMAHYGGLLTELVATPDIPIGTVPLLTPAQRETVLTRWNRTATPRPPGATLPDLLRRQAARTPDAPALRCGEDLLSYRELLDRAEHYAARLAALGIGRGDVIGVSVPRSVDLVVLLLAVLCSGAAYLPLDPAHPAERRERALRDSGAALLLDGTGVLDAVTGSPPWQPPRLDPADVAYVIYTSGSTGTPKGVVVAHDGVCNNAAWRREVTGLGPGDRLLHTVSFAFDPSVWQLFGPLLAGAEVVLAGPAEAGDPARFAALVRAHRVTIADFVPSLLAQVLDVARPGDLDSLTHIFCGGERLPRDLAARCHALTNAVLHNQYGPTEATIDTTSHLVPPDEPEHDVSIGRPIANKRVYVLDEHLQPVPPGVAGELWIGGTGLAHGYLRDPRQTAARFAPDPFGSPGSRMYRSGDLVRHRRDGALVFLGRLDEQVKVNGVRIEPAEVAAALRRHPDVADAVVVLREVAGRPALVGYVVPAGRFDPATLREHVAGQLPAAFVPAHVVALPAIPLGPNGKVDAARLPAVAPRRADGPARTAPPGSVAAILTGLWHEVLGRDDLGVDDDFFALGGDSLLAVRLVSAVRDRFGVALALPEFFEAATPARLATLITARRAVPPPTPAPALVRRNSATAPLSFAQERVYRQALAGAGPDELHLSIRARLSGDLDATALAGALRAVVARHEALRVAIAGETQTVQQPYDIRLDTPDELSLDSGRLLDAGLTRLGPTEHELSLTLHRIAADGVSTQLLTRDLALSYAALRAGRRAELPALPVQHPDYAHWERAAHPPEAVAGAVRDWLRDAGDLAWLRKFPRPAGAHRASRSTVLDPARVHALSTVARRHRTTTRTVLLTAWAAACARRFDVPGLLACVPVSGRDTPAVRDMVGRLVNLALLPVRPEHAGRVDLVHAAAADGYDRAARLPFLAVERAVDPDHAGTGPVFPILFDAADPPAELPALAGLEVTVTPPREPWSDFGLAFRAARHPGGLELTLLYDPDGYPDELAAGLCAEVLEVLP
ncbi:amino acid adenylation domain-containing protein, partial [Actinophytocola sp.]|uniref:non-ribosomal peptide synthetase n=1 Tax=Actinophytocola sp. TaxID=1872138 RepID=UPI002D80C652